MASELISFNPRSVWAHFSAISQIPRCSGNEAAVLAFLRSKASEWGLKSAQDSVGNLCVYKPASVGREASKTVILQGHVDMVCEQNRGRGHDFACDPIELVLDGDWVKAKETTLGADNGIAVAMMLAVLEDRSLVHGPLECLFTVDEETALTGALGLDASMLHGQFLINLDSEDVGRFTVGCAGGMTSSSEIELSRSSASTSEGALAVFLKGLPGGHSGVEIHKQIGNALGLSARLVERVRAAHPLWKVSHWEGGDKHNAIPREASVTLVGPKQEFDAVRKTSASAVSVFAEELGYPQIQVSVEPAAGSENPFDEASTEKLVRLLLALPDGVQGMSRVVPGLVETSCNVASIRTLQNRVVVTTSQRSSRVSLRDSLGRKIESVVRLAGGKTTHKDGYPAWSPKEISPLRDLCVDLWNRTNQEKAVIELIHAGLECGVIGDKMTGLDMISFGPTILGAHTPDERMDVRTVVQVWNFLIALLKELP